MTERTPTPLSLNDEVEVVHLALWDSDPRYPRYLEAVYDEQAVEGSLAADNVMAAELIREYAKVHDFDPAIAKLANQKLATISKALGVVMRRYGVSRKERRDMLGGVIVLGNGE